MKCPPPSEPGSGKVAAQPPGLLTISGAPVDRIGLGTWGLGGAYTIGGRPAGIPDSAGLDPHALLTHALDGGINFLDSSGAYGRAEEVVGACVARRRPDIFIASKCGLQPDGSRDYGFNTLRRSLEASMKRLRTDVIDLFQISLGPGDPVEKALEGLNRLKQCHALRYVGLSVANAAQIAGAVRCRGCDAIQVAFNLLDTRCGQAADQAAASGLYVLIKSPLNKGVLSGSHLGDALPQDDSRRLYLTPSVVEKRRRAVRATLARAGHPGGRLEEIAMDFVLSAPFTAVVFFGARRREHVDRLLRCKRREPLPGPMFNSLAEAARQTWPEVAETFAN